MGNIFEAIKGNALFEHISKEEFDKTLCCISAKSTFYSKGDIIILAGDLPRFIGLVLSGSVRIIKEDIRGNRIILGDVKPPGLFGEMYAWSKIKESPITVQAVSDCEVLLIDFRNIIKTCSSSCSAHKHLIQNMFQIMADKIVMLDHKVNIVSRRTIRERLLCFLDSQSGGNKKITISLNREEMASFLCVDRSALSAELSKMQKEGLIKFSRNQFELLY